MPRTKKETASEAEEPVDEITEVVAEEVAEETESKADPMVDKLMKLYPQYESLYITPDGFVHPAGASRFFVEGATLYKNKYFNK